MNALIGRDRALADSVIRTLRKQAPWPSRGFGDSRRDRIDAYETPRGGVFEVQAAAPDDRAGDPPRIYRVTVELMPPETQAGGRSRPPRDYPEVDPRGPDHTP